MKTSRWPISHLPISGVTPFTYRDGETYLSMLNRLAQYVTEQLHPSLRETVEHMVEELEHIITAQHSKYVEGIQDFQRIHDAFMTDVNSALMALNDNAVADLANDPGSVFGATIRELFPSSEGLQEFQDNVSDRVERTATASLETTEIYVATSGSNTTGTGTVNNPYQTITYACAQIPDIVRLNHHYHVVITPGHYPEDARIANKIAFGRITVGGETTDRDLYTVRTFTADRVSGQMTLNNMVSTVDDDESAVSFEFRACGPMMSVSNVATTPDKDGPLPQTRGLLADYGSTVRVSDSDFSGKRYGIRSNYQSQLHVNTSNKGSGNSIGVATRWGGILTAYYGGLPTGNTAMSTNSGGTIVLGHGGVVGDIDETGLVDHTNYRGRGITSKTWVLSDDNLPSHHVDGEIPEGSTVRFRFRAPEDNIPMTIHVDWVARASLTAAQGVSSVSTVFFRGNDFTTQGTSNINKIGASDVALSTRGSVLDFYVDITGARAEAGLWSATVRIDVTTPDHMPIYAAAELL